MLSTDSSDSVLDSLCSTRMVTVQVGDVAWVVVVRRGVVEAEFVGGAWRGVIGVDPEPRWGMLSCDAWPSWKAHSIASHWARLPSKLMVSWA